MINHDVLRQGQVPARGTFITQFTGKLQAASLLWLLRRFRARCLGSGITIYVDLLLSNDPWKSREQTGRKVLGRGLSYLRWLSMVDLCHTLCMPSRSLKGQPK
jgi:hypothetical protein